MSYLLLENTLLIKFVKINLKKRHPNLICELNLLINFFGISILFIDYHIQATTQVTLHLKLHACLFIDRSVNRILSCPHRAQILPKLAAPHKRLSRPATRLG